MITHTQMSIITPGHWFHAILDIVIITVAKNKVFKGLDKLTAVHIGPDTDRHQSCTVIAVHFDQRLQYLRSHRDALFIASYS